MQNNSVLERSYINDFHRQNSMGAVKEVESMLLHPYSREQKLAQINSLRQKALSKENCGIRHRILTITIPRWSAIEIEQLQICLSCIATQPDANDNDILALSIIQQFNLAEEKWIKEWTAFKRERCFARNMKLKQLEK